MAADVREVLRTIARLGGMNMVLHDSVSGRFTFEAKAMPLEELLGLVITINGLQAKRLGTSLVIAKDDQKFGEAVTELEIGSFRMNNALAAEVLATLTPMVDAKTTKISADKRTNTIVVYGPSAEIIKVRNAVRALDVNTPQVIIDVKLVEFSTTVARRLGAEFGFGGSKFGVANNVGDLTATAGNNPTAGVPVSGAGASSITFSSMGNITSNLNARINALVQDGNARVLANPRVAAMDNVEAEIRLVNKFPVVQVNVNGSQGAVTESVEFRDIGETLKITPRIDTAGFVTMKLAPTISVRGKDVIVNGNPVPEINERRVDTTLRVADGEAVVIGGLIRRNTNKTINKMPILGDLPVVGFLFRNETTDTIETEVVIMVTPRIASEKGTEPAGYRAP